MSKRSPNARQFLRALEGPVAGQTFPLSVEEPLLIGRSTRGVHLVDPSVNLEHAEVAWEVDSFWLVDLRSTNGTFVDRNPIGGAPVRLKPGMIIQVGESVFRVEVKPVVPPWAAPVIAASVFVIVGCGLLVMSWVAPLEYRPSLTPTAPVSAGGTTLKRLDLPVPFVRRVGQDHRALAVRRVTDYDEDDVSEVWITGKDREWVFTFEPDGAWRELGELPLGCRDLQGQGMPELKCGIRTYRMDEASRSYTLVDQEGVIAWMRPAGPPDPKAKAKAKAKAVVGADVPGAVVPHLATLTAPEGLAGFLADRGVTEPIHYLVCEGAFPDARPQVVTASGRQIPLPVGCIRDIKIAGTFPSGSFSSEVPAAIAFTAHGHDALLRDLRTLLYGNTDEMFVSPDDRKLVELAAMEPARLGTMLVEFNSGTEVEGWPVAREREVDGVRRLVTADRRAGAPLASVVDLPGPGSFTVDLPGCHDLLVTTTGWSCAMTKWCREGSDFVEVRQTGCERNEVVAKGVYANGRWRGRAEGVEVEVQVDGASDGGRFDVLRTRLAYRVPP